MVESSKAEASPSRAEAPIEHQHERPAASARSLLLTVLGEFVLPRGGAAWTTTLVQALAALGVEEKSARQALSRTAAEGLLAATRHGRRVHWQLTAAGSRLLTEGTERIYGFMRTPRSWDGRWLVLHAAIPEAQRQVRHRLRTRLTWLGMGSPAPGVWVVPDASKADDVQAVVRELELQTRVFAWTGPAVEIAGTGPLIGAAWDLAAVEKRYLEFIGLFAATAVATDRDVFAAQVLLIQEWRRFPFLDPDLPAELLNHDWPGTEAATVFHALHDRWHRRAQAEWDRMDRQAAARL